MIDFVKIKALFIKKVVNLNLVCFLILKLITSLTCAEYILVVTDIVY